jgi:hypothetical protein
MAKKNESLYLTFSVSKIVPYVLRLSLDLNERERLSNSGLLSLKGLSTRHFYVQVRILKATSIPWNDTKWQIFCFEKLNLLR